MNTVIAQEYVTLTIYSFTILLYTTVYYCNVSTTVSYCTILLYSTIQYCYNMNFSLVVDTAVPVSFSKANYDVTEGEKSVDITLQALKNHTFPFSVIVSTRDGNATCKCQAVVYGQTCTQLFLWLYYFCNSRNFRVNFQMFVLKYFPVLGVSQKYITMNM